jgi:periplasmic protein CpxP/Spy
MVISGCTQSTPRTVLTLRKDLTMKRLNVVLAMLMLFVLTGAGLSQRSSAAQVDQQHKTKSEQATHQEVMAPEAMVERLSTQLNLTEDQKAKIKPMAEDVYKQMNEVRQDSSLSEQERREKIRQIHENALGQVKTILNPEQQKKLDEMMANHPHQGELHSQGGQGESANPHHSQ